MAFSVSGRLLFAGYDDFECKVRVPLVFGYHGRPHSQACADNLDCRCGMFYVARRSEHSKDMTTVSAA